MPGKLTQYINTIEYRDGIVFPMIHRGYIELMIKLYLLHLGQRNSFIAPHVNSRSYT